MTLSIMKLCHYAECHCAECRDLFIGMLNVVMLSVVRLNVVMLSVVRLNVVMQSVGVPNLLPNYCRFLCQELLSSR
jgi:hypothetical protein